MLFEKILFCYQVVINSLNISKHNNNFSYRRICWDTIIVLVYINICGCYFCILIVIDEGNKIKRFVVFICCFQVNDAFPYSFILYNKKLPLFQRLRVESDFIKNLEKELVKLEWLKMFLF